MAGVDPNAGMSVGTISVPAIGGEGQGVVVASEHLNGPRSEGVSYPENPGVGPFPEGTRMTDNTPSENVN